MLAALLINRTIQLSYILQCASYFAACYVFKMISKIQVFKLSIQTLIKLYLNVFL